MTRLTTTTLVFFICALVGVGAWVAGKSAGREAALSAKGETGSNAYEIRVEAARADRAACQSAKSDRTQSALVYEASRRGNLRISRDEFQSHATRKARSEQAKVDKRAAITLRLRTGKRLNCFKVYPRPMKPKVPKSKPGLADRVTGGR